MTDEQAEAIRIGERLREEIVAPLIVEFKNKLSREKRLGLEAFRAVYTELLRKAVRGCCALLEERDFGDIYFHRQVIFFAHFCEAMNSAISPRFPYRLAIVSIEREAVLSVVVMPQRIIRRHFKSLSSERIFYFFAATAKDMRRLHFEGACHFTSPADILKMPGN